MQKQHHKAKKEKEKNKKKKAPLKAPLETTPDGDREHANVVPPLWNQRNCMTVQDAGRGLCRRYTWPALPADPRRPGRQRVL